MFSERGVSTGEISILLFAWSLVAFALEVPSGALADRFDRRHVLAGAQAVRAVGFLLWWLAPTFEGYLAGFVLWGVKSALTSGAFEALVFDELHSRGHQSRYARLMGRAEACSLAAQVIGALVAAAVVDLGFPPVLWASALAAVPAALLLLSFPRAPATEPVAEHRYLHYLREGIRHAATNRAIRRLVLFSGAVGGLAAVDEFFGLLLRDAGFDNAGISLWHAAFFVAAVVGSLVAHRLATVSPRTLALIAGVWGAALLSTSLDGRVAVATGLLVFNGLFYLQGVALDARLQAAIESRARATITSVQGLVDELFALGTFLAFGAIAGASSNRWATASIALAIIVVAITFGIGWRASRVDQ